MDLEILKSLTDLSEEQILDIEEFSSLEIEESIQNLRDSFFEHNSDILSCSNDLYKYLPEDGKIDFQWLNNCITQTAMVDERINSIEESIEQLTRWGNQWKTLCIKLLEGRISGSMEYLLSVEAESRLEKIDNGNDNN